jgi:nucleotide-binding universal stress UspA family protein
MAYPFRAILSPIQFDDPSLWALGFAKSIAKDQGAMLHLLHVVAMVSALGQPAINAMLHSRAVEKAIEALNNIAAKHLEGVSYVIHTRFASHKGLARAINEVAARLTRI